MTFPAPVLVDVLPHDSEAERTVLGAVLVDNAAFNSAAEILTRDDFYREVHRLIFDAMVVLAARGEPIDLVILKTQLLRASTLEAAGGAAYLAGLLDGVPRIPNVKAWAQIIKEKAVLRNLIHESGRIIEACYADGPVEEIRSKAAAMLQTSAVVSARFLRPLNVAEIYADSTLDDLRWLWDSYVPEESFALLVSFMKEGKSTLFYALLGAMVNGREFLGRPTRCVPTLVLAVEEHLREVKAHLRESGIGPDAPVFVHSGLYPNTAEGLAELRGFISANGIKLLVIDTLSRFWRIENENDAAEVIEKLGPLLDLARELRISIFLLHHTTKAQAEFSFGREIRGNGAIFGLVDQALILSRAKGGSPSLRVLRAVGRFAETPPETLMDYDEETGFRVIQAETQEHRDEGREQKILGFVATTPGKNRTTVQQGARIGRQKGLQIIETLIREGRLAARDGGLYLGSGPLAEPAGTLGTSGQGSGGSRHPLKGGMPEPNRLDGQPCGTEAEP